MIHAPARFSVQRLAKSMTNGVCCIDNVAVVSLCYQTHTRLPNLETGWPPAVVPVFRGHHQRKKHGGDDAMKQQQIEKMTPEQLSAHIQHRQQEITQFVDQLVSHAALQTYADQQYDELLVLLEEALTVLEGISPFPLEWMEKRNALIAKIKRKV
jgi:hypothetical protein